MGDIELRGVRRSRSRGGGKPVIRGMGHGSPPPRKPVRTFREVSQSHVRTPEQKRRRHEAIRRRQWQLARNVLRNHDITSRARERWLRRSGPMAPIFRELQKPQEMARAAWRQVLELKVKILGGEI